MPHVIDVLYVLYVIYDMYGALTYTICMYVNMGVKSSVAQLLIGYPILSYY